MTGSLAGWPVKVGKVLGGFVTVGCNQPGCHAEFARIHIGELEPPVETTFTVGLALVEAHEADCPTPAPVEPAVCGALWTIHRCAQPPDHKKVGDGRGHRCTCGSQPALNDRVGSGQAL